MDNNTVVIPLIKNEDGKKIKYIATYNKDELKEEKLKIIKEAGVIIEKEVKVDVNSDFFKSIKKSIVSSEFIGGGEARVTYVTTDIPNIAKLIDGVLNENINSLNKILNKDTSDEIKTFDERYKEINEKIDEASIIDSYTKNKLNGKLTSLVATMSYNLDKRDPKEYYDEVRALIKLKKADSLEEESYNSNNITKKIRG